MSNLNEIPDLIFPIVGYRVWRNDFKGIQSIAHPKFWDAGIQGSEHFNLINWVPCSPSACLHSSAYGCGFYAFKHLPELIEYIDELLPASEYRIFGEVYLSGEVIEHEFGWRASRARIKGFYNTKSGVEGAKRINVPILPLPKELEGYEHRRESESVAGGGNASGSSWITPGTGFITVDPAPRGTSVSPATATSGLTQAQFQELASLMTEAFSLGLWPTQ